MTEKKHYGLPDYLMSLAVVVFVVFGLAFLAGLVLKWAWFFFMLGWS